MIPAKFKAKIERLEKELARVRPASADGTLVSRTTRGTVRRVVAKVSTKDNGSSSTVPEWG
jgi:ribosomal protein L29